MVAALPLASGAATGPCECFTASLGDLSWPPSFIPSMLSHAIVDVWPRTSNHTNSIAYPGARDLADDSDLTSPVMTTPRPLTATLLPQSQHGPGVPVHCISPLDKLADTDADSIVPDDSASGRDEDVQSTVSFDISPDDAVGERGEEGDDTRDLDGWVAC